MSCIIQKSENTAALADYIASLMNTQFEFSGMEAPASLFEALSGCRDSYGFTWEDKVYNALSELNLAAYNGRYNENVVDYPKYKHNPLVKFAECANGHYIIEDWHYKIFKMLCFLIYQCREDATCHTPLYNALIDLKTALAFFIAFNVEQCAAVDWE